MTSFLNTGEKKEFTHRLLLWGEKLPVLHALAAKKAKLTAPPLARTQSTGGQPLVNLGMSELYDKCEMLLADMATSLTSHHTQRWQALLPYLLEHVATLITKDEFPALYAHFCMLDNQLTNAVKRPEDKYLAGQCVQCGRELFAEKRARELECPRCHTLNDLETTRADLDVQRQLLAERYLFTGPLDQVTTVYNMFNCSDLSARQVLALLESGVIRGVKTGRDEWFVDTRSLARV